MSEPHAAQMNIDDNHSLTPPSDDLVEGVDFYREGQAVVLDVNRTPGILGAMPDRQKYAAQLAPGVCSLF